MSKLKIFGIAMAAGMMIAGCNKNESEEPATVATVNGASLSSTELKGDVEKLLAAQGDKIPAEQKEYYKQMIRNQIVQSFIYENVLVAKAKALGVTVTDADRKDREEKFLKAVARMPDAPKTLEEHFQKFPLGSDRARREFENGILIDKMIKAEAEKQAKGDFEKEAQKTIDEIIAANRKAEGSATEALKKINALKDQLAKVKADELPAKFAELAKANSDCPSKEKGGDLGAFAHGQMVKEFDEAAFKLPVGKLSEPVKTQFGYHLILTTKKFPPLKPRVTSLPNPKRSRPATSSSKPKVCVRFPRRMRWSSSIRARPNAKSSPNSWSMKSRKPISPSPTSSRAFCRLMKNLPQKRPRLKPPQNNAIISAL